MKRLSLVIVVGLMAGLAASWAATTIPYVDLVARTNSGVQPNSERSATSTLLFVGDIMLSRQIGVLVAAHQNPRFPFRLIASTTRAADLAIGNLENPVSARGSRRREKFAFRAAPETLAGLRAAGFDVVTLANNHIGDYGSLAMRDTFRSLDEYGIDYVGADTNFENAHQAVLRTVNGRTIAFLGYTNIAPAIYSRKDARPAVADINPERIADDVSRARERGADRVVAMLHWGVEYAPDPTERQREIARRIIDAGADLVIGHHPHVVQPVERYNGGVIAYSLGNFVFDQNFRNTRTGLLLEVEIGPSGVETTKRPVKFTEQYQPYLADDTI